MDNPSYNVCHIYILGLGCSINYSGLVAKKKYYENTTKKNINIFCNTDTRDSRASVAKVYLCNVSIRTNTPFVQHVYKFVLEQINNNKVIIVGHSYGGAVASKIAELFSKNRPKEECDRLHIATMGSIYISPKNKVENIDIINYMHVNDISMNCNGLKQPVLSDFQNEDLSNTSNDQNIVWIKKNNERINKRSVFSHNSWKIHRSVYTPLNLSIFINDNIHLTDKKYSEYF